MRDGYRIIDVDTHLDPSLEVLLRYGDKGLAERAEEIKSTLSGNILRLQRVAGRKKGLPARRLPTHTVQAGAQAGVTPPADNRGGPFGARQLNTRPYAPRVQDDNAVGRLEDMDIEGIDIHFLIPGTWIHGITALEPQLGRGLYEAYHRYIADYCSADPRRLKGLILVPGADPEWAAKTIRQHAKEEWAAVVYPTLPEGLPIDDPDLEPIWAAAAEADLPIMYHGFTVAPPYFPGYRDIWDNMSIARCAGQPWGGQRFLAYMLVSGILDRYPNLRVGITECGHGWLPHWLLRVGRHVEFARQNFPPELKHMPLDYLKQGRVFCGIDYAEGPEVTKTVIDVLGDGVLMHSSDYPHPEAMFPNTAGEVLSWKRLLGEEATRKMMWDNAARYLRLLSTPFDGKEAQAAAEARTARS